MQKVSLSCQDYLRTFITEFRDLKEKARRDADLT